MFIPGETIAHGFVIPFSSDVIDYVVVSYKHNDDIIFEKKISSDFEPRDDKSTYFLFTFTQKEGLLFPDDSQYTIQCNVYTKGGSRHTSRPIKSKTGTQYLKEVMSSG